MYALSLVRRMDRMKILDSFNDSFIHLHKDFYTLVKIKYVIDFAVKKN